MVQFYKDKKKAKKSNKHSHAIKTEQLKNVSIDTYDHTGQGLILSSKPITVVKNALIDEIFDASVEYKNNKVRIVKAHEFHQQHPQRLSPFCAHYNNCGGCSMQHTSAKYGLEIKQAALQTYMHQSAGVAIDLWQAPIKSDIDYEAATVPLPKFGYRRRIRLAVDSRNKKDVRIGFRGEKSKDIIAISQCAIASPNIQKILPMLLDCLKQLPSVSSIGHIVLTDTSTKVYCALFCTGNISAKSQVLLKACIEQIIEAEYTASLALVIYQNQALNELLNCDSEYFTLVDAAGISIETNSSQFLQVNAGVNAQMLKQAQEWIGHGQTLYDFYCGSGNFALVLAERFEQVFGFEGVDDMLTHARANAKTNQISNIEFSQCNLDDISTLNRLVLSPDSTVVLDPARAGAQALCEKLAKVNVSQILYVSCNPNSLIRDLNILQSQYNIEKISALDMFPFTKHLEVMVLLKNKQ